MLQDKLKKNVARITDIYAFMMSDTPGKKQKSRAMQKSHSSPFFIKHKPISKQT